jgi:hypothetical protein
MAKREMQQFSVEPCDEGLICIIQEAPGFDQPFTVSIHPDQIEGLVKWLNEVRDELKKK